MPAVFVSRRLPYPDTSETPSSHADVADAGRGAPLRLVVAGSPVRGFAGETVAVALHAAGERILSRSLKYHRPRSFFCLAGHCGGCLMRIDGVPNRRACLTPCVPDLRVEAQNAYPAADLDALEAIDWMFPDGMDHHTLMTGSATLNAIANKVVRQLSGLGQLPERPADRIPPVREHTPDVCVIGAGPAGLAAATAAAAAAADTLSIDEYPRPGGSLRGDPRYGPADADRRAAAAAAAGAVLLPGATAIAFFPEDEPPVLAVSTGDGLVLVRARRYVYATGGYAHNRPFANNDRPGVIAARAAGRLLVEHRVRPGARVCVIGDDDYAAALARALAEAGSDVHAVDGTARRVVRARGRRWVSGVDVIGPDGDKRRLDCDLVAVSAIPSPASEAPRQHGCRVVLDPPRGGFRVVTDDDGHTSIPDVLACGDVTGFAGPEAATRAGARVGAVAAAEARKGAP